MTAVEDRLAEIEALAGTATVGPWVFDVDNEVTAGGFYVANVGGDDDGRFIAHARTDVPELIAALRAVLGIHYDEDGYCPGCGLDTYEEERKYGNCSTISAITAALGVTP